MQKINFKELEAIGISIEELGELREIIKDSEGNIIELRKLKGGKDDRLRNN